MLNNVENSFMSHKPFALLGDTLLFENRICTRSSHMSLLRVQKRFWSLCNGVAGSRSKCKKFRTE